MTLEAALWSPHTDMYMPVRVGVCTHTQKTTENLIASELILCSSPLNGTLSPIPRYDLEESRSHRLLGVNAWSPAGGTGLKFWEGKVLLEKMGC